jgi:hypothetical protein
MGWSDCLLSPAIKPAVDPPQCAPPRIARVVGLANPHTHARQDRGHISVYTGRMGAAKNVSLLVGLASLAVGAALLIEGWSGGGNNGLGFGICAIGFAIVAAVKFA